MKLCPLVHKPITRSRIQVESHRAALTDADQTKSLNSRMVGITGSYSEMGSEEFSNSAKSGHNKGTIKR